MEKQQNQTPKKLSPKRGLIITSEEQLRKIEEAKASTSGALPVDDYWILLAEFGMKFGWEAYQSAKNDEIPLEEMMTLIEASRKIDYLNQYVSTQNVFVGTASAKAEKPSNTFKQMTSKLLKKAKADI